MSWNQRLYDTVVRLSHGGWCPDETELSELAAALRADASAPSDDIALLLNRLILAAGSKGYQHGRDVPVEDRITDADIDKLERQILAKARADASARPPSAGWHPIDNCPLAEMVLLWGGAWRHPFAGMRTGDFGQCFIDGDPGFHMHATHWMPLPGIPPRAGAGE